MEKEDVRDKVDIITKYQDKKQDEWDVKRVVFTYLQEFSEVFISILIIRVAMEKEINIYKIVQASAFIGLITFFLENYNPNFNSNIKQGITFSVGSQMISTFMN